MATRASTPKSRCPKCSASRRRSAARRKARRSSRWSSRSTWTSRTTSVKSSSPRPRRPRKRQRRSSRYGLLRSKEPAFGSAFVLGDTLRMRGWLVVVLAGCGRLAFDPIGAPPLVSFRAEPNVGGREREIRITYEVGDASGGEHLEIRRAAPQPPVDCNDGDVVNTTTQLASATVIDRVT